MELSTNTTNITIICKTNKYELGDQLQIGVLIYEKNYINWTGPDRSSDHGPKTAKTGPRTGTGTGLARTDPTLKISSCIKSFI